MKNIIYISFIMLSLLVSSCGRSFMANSDYDRSVNLRNYQTFKISNEQPNRADVDPILNNEFNRNRISDAVLAQLKGRGYVEAESNPDLLVKFYVRVKDRQQTQTSTNYGWYYPRTNAYTRNYEESTLIIDLVDGNTKKLVWQGWVLGEKEYKSKNIEQKLWNQVKEVFNTYPVQPKQEIEKQSISFKK